jgi:hypothetical protein
MSQNMQLIFSPCDSQRFDQFELFKHQPHIRYEAAFTAEKSPVPLLPERQALVVLLLHNDINQNQVVNLSCTYQNRIFHARIPFSYQILSVLFIYKITSTKEWRL